MVFCVGSLFLIRRSSLKLFTVVFTLVRTDVLFAPEVLGGDTADCFADCRASCSIAYCEAILPIVVFGVAGAGRVPGPRGCFS